ncbi:SDR family oxidoreductase [Variovorax paradoxus]|nr:SDR family oxidoreductase [Variovorax paradoxus]
MGPREAKLAVVIGGGNGIGEACCRVMAERGWRIAVVDLDLAAAERIAKEISGRGYEVDIRNLEAMEALADCIERDSGPVHSLVVTAAAFQERHAPHAFPMDQWRAVMQVNLEGTFNANRVFGTRMARRGGGSIVNTASVVGHGSSPQLAYGPSKAAVLNLTQSLASEWGHSGVRVNSVSPGSTLTARHLARDPGRYAKNIDSQMALGRRMQPNEVAEGIEFLASDRASAITGTDLLIDAGWLAASTWGFYGGVPGAKGAEEPAPGQILERQPRR